MARIHADAEATAAKVEADLIAKGESEATSLIPTSLAAAELTEGYAEGGPYRIFFDFAEAFAKVRPETPEGTRRLSSSTAKAPFGWRMRSDPQTLA